MKRGFILLLLLNVLYFGWETHNKPQFEPNRPTMAAMPVPPGLTPLILLSELEALPEHSAFPTLAQDHKSPDNNKPPQALLGIAPLLDDPSAIQLHDEPLSQYILTLGKHITSHAALCLSYGPILHHEELASLTDWFQQRKIAIRSRENKTKDAQQRFRVYLDLDHATGSPSSTIKALKKKGLKDPHLVQLGEQKIGISLGVFTAKKRAENYVKRLKKTVDQPQIFAYHEKNTYYWLDVILDKTQSTQIDTQTDLPANYNVNEIDCDQIVLAEINP